ncbi:MAG: DUF1847 domain-containing protein [Deltaproteobacteria bacterium]|nr:DUF1847 domain-containing protein [Deltaproteobacteria bacterium]
MSDQSSPRCGLCSLKDRICMTEDGEGPTFCPTKNYQDLIEQTTAEYNRPEIRQFAQMASRQEAAGYTHRDVRPYVLHPDKTRIQEIWEFAQRMGYTKLGIAFCIGLHKEARTVTKILEARGFEVVSVCCKVGGVPKETLGLGEEEKIYIGQFESMCNPITQAEILNREKTDFNILVGLCVGHDSLFFKHAQAYTTVLVAKDRVLGHNPVAALYTTHSYYQRLLKPESDPEPLPRRSD